MSRLDRYIFREWLKVFLLSLLALYGILLLNDVEDNFGDLLGFGATTEEIVTFYAIKLPAYLPVALPLTFMVSLLFCLGQFHRNHELTAMRAAGLNLFRITRSLWLVAFILTGVAFYLNAQLVPWSVEQSRTLRNDMAFAKAIAEDVPEEEIGLLYNLTFHNRRDGRLWFINRFNEFNYRAYGITVSELGAEGRESRRVMANLGFFDEYEREWVFMEGRSLSFDPESGDPVRSLPFDRERMSGYGEDPALMQFLEKEPEDLSLPELQRVVNYLEPEKDPRLARYAVTFYDRLFNPLSCLIVIGLAIPFSVRGVRTNPFVGVSKAMGLLLVYYLLLHLAHISGTRGLPPLVAALAPNLAALGPVLYYSLQLNRPS
jgi:lipopolysaccharide export system permease protein